MLTGPYEVIRIIPPVNYVLQKSPKPQPLVAHADKLKRCYSQLPEAQGCLSLSTDGPSSRATEPWPIFREYFLKMEILFWKYSNFGVKATLSYVADVQLYSAKTSFGDRVGVDRGMTPLPSLN